MVDCLRLQRKPLFSEQTHLFIKVPGEGVSTCRSKGLNGELIERSYDSVIASHSLQENIKKMEVKEDFESRPHKAVFLGRKRQNSRREQKMPNALPGSSGGKLPGRSMEEEGREEEEGEEERQEKKMDNEVIRGIIAGVPMEAFTVGGGVSRNTVSAAPSTYAGEDSFNKSEIRVGRKHDLKRNEQSFKQKLSNRRRYWRRRCYGLV